MTDPQHILTLFHEMKTLTQQERGIRLEQLRLHAPPALVEELESLLAAVIQTA